MSENLLREFKGMRGPHGPRSGHGKVQVSLFLLREEKRIYDQLRMGQQIQYNSEPTNYLIWLRQDEGLARWFDGSVRSVSRVFEANSRV